MYKNKVYFIQAMHNNKCKGLIKIGTTNDIKKRLKDLQVGSSLKLKIIGTLKGGRKVESRLHKKFKHIRQHGEWFSPTKELLNFIKMPHYEFLYPKKSDTYLVKLTPEIMKLGMSNNGGWSLKQLRLFGINTLTKGWKEKIIGKKFPQYSIEEFVTLKNHHLMQQEFNTNKKI